ncbi:MAG: acetoacetate metabolism regulatory protein AtoC [Bryobacteraceae bacterium]|nr:MAG: acetoacetate metabolism regulatory protein AtoC [Bryobacteraceae bacterium]
MSTLSILIVDDDASLRQVMSMQLEEMGYRALAASSGDEALHVLGTETVALVITDYRMPGMNGLELLEKIRSDYPLLPVIMITAFGSIGNAVEAIKAGAFDYISKPIDFDQLAIVVRRALEHHTLLEEVQALRSMLDQKFGFQSIIGRSKPLLRVLEQAARTAQSKATVLIRGETGTGKELLARAIHANSPRRTRPFVTINCGAIPKELMESELFGHVRGSFTGAVAHKLGRAEAADGGTLFLDEIGELPPDLQVKLLRLVQEGEIEKVGSPVSRKVDVRIIAATHRNLEALIEDGQFREDLYYRISVIPLELPPLRERGEDVAELAEFFFLRCREKHGRPELVLPPALLPCFTSWHWPGNVRELENVIERLVVLAPGPEITLNDLPEHLRGGRRPAGTLDLDIPPQGISLEAVERHLILQALRRADWNQSQAARLLDISRKTLIYRMEKYGLRQEAE